jgi:hypothetical protein
MKAFITSQDALDVRGDELSGAGWRVEGFVSDVSDEVFGDCRWGFAGGWAD